LLKDGPDKTNQSGGAFLLEHMSQSERFERKAILLSFCQFFWIEDIHIFGEFVVILITISFCRLWGFVAES